MGVLGSGSVSNLIGWTKVGLIRKVICEPKLKEGRQLSVRVSGKVSLTDKAESTCRHLKARECLRSRGSQGGKRGQRGNGIISLKAIATTRRLWLLL